MQNITSTPPGDEPRAGEATPAQGDQHTGTPANDAEASAPEEPAGPTMGEALDHAWKNRDKATAEAKRLVVEGPSVFRQADLSSKIAVLALLVVLAAFIVNTVLTPRQADQREALDQIGEAFAGVGEDIDEAADDLEQSNVGAAAQNTGDTIQKVATPAQAPSPAADPAAKEDKKTDAPDRP